MDVDLELAGAERRPRKVQRVMKLGRAKLTGPGAEAVGDGKRGAARQRRRNMELALSPGTLVPWNEVGALDDGGLVIVDERGDLRHVTPARVAASLRYLLARLQSGSETGLQSGTETGVPRRIAFTSALSGEGVSFTANSFATVLAHDLRRRVCVVDLNWWADDVGGDDGADERSGMFEVVWNGSPIAEALVATQSPDLWLLRSGRAPVSVRPTLARNEMLVELLDQLDQHFDHLVFDLPAVLMTSDAIALAALCDGYVLVVRQGTATRAQISDAIDGLRRVPALGIVLNQVRTAIPRPIRRILGL